MATSNSNSSQSQNPSSSSTDSSPLRSGAQAQSEFEPANTTFLEAPAPRTTTTEEARHMLLKSQEIADSSFGGYNCSFVSEPDHSLLCLICTRVLRQPELTDCCGNHYCWSCLQRWLRESTTTGTGGPLARTGQRDLQSVTISGGATRFNEGKCPLCRETGFVTFRDKKVERRVQELKVKCKHRLSGCSWMGELRDLGPHLRLLCPQVLTECSNQCGCVLERQELNKHLEYDCHKRSVVCEHCEQTFIWEQLLDHCVNRCVKFPLECPNKCSTDTIPREDLQDHIKSVCPLEQLECAYKVFGCDAIVARKDMKKHEVKMECYHLALTRGSLSATMEMVENTDQKVSELRSKYESQLQSQAEEIQQMKLQLANLLELQNNHTLRLSSIAAHTRHSSNAYSSNAASSSSEAGYETYTSTSDDLVNSDHAVICTSGSSGFHTASTFINCASRSGTTVSPGPHAVSTSAASSLDLCIMEVHLLSKSTLFFEEPFLPLVIKMSEFSKKKSSRELWQSPPFYVDPFGYKVSCACVPNGCCNGLNTHISVYMHLMAGEFDNDLTWPADEQIAVELMNQLEPRGHHYVDCPLTRDMPLTIRKRIHGDASRNERAHRGSGTPTFIQHSKLGLQRENKCQYLKNDCLYFSIY